MPAICPTASVFDESPVPEVSVLCCSDPEVEVVLEDGLEEAEEPFDVDPEDGDAEGVVVVDDTWLALLLALLVAFTLELPVVAGGADDEGGADEEEPDPNATVMGPLVALVGGLSLPSRTM